MAFYITGVKGRCPGNFSPSSSNFEAVALIAAIAFSFVGVNYDWIPLLQS
jgi:hypothetical protein